MCANVHTQKWLSVRGCEGVSPELSQLQSCACIGSSPPSCGRQLCDGTPHHWLQNSILRRLVRTQGRCWWQMSRTCSALSQCAHHFFFASDRASGGVQPRRSLGHHPYQGKSYVARVPCRLRRSCDQSAERSILEHRTVLKNRRPKADELARIPPTKPQAKGDQNDQLQLFEHARLS